MSETTNLKLFKHDEPLSTNQNQFDIDKALHQNWDKIDEYVGANNQNIQNLQSQNTDLQQENVNLQQENNLLKSQIPNGQAVGENITLTDSSNLPYKKFNIGGKSVQETRSGKNFFNANKITNTNIIVENNGQKITMPIVTSGNGYINLGQTLSQLCPSLKVGDKVTLRFNTTSSTNKYIHLLGITHTWKVNEELIITEEALNGSVYLYANNYANGETEQVIITDMSIMLFSQTDTEWEAFGASPSPEYPSEIRSVGDDVNIFDGEFEIGLISGSTGQDGVNDNYIRNKNLIPVEPQTNYKFSTDSTLFPQVYVYEYKEDGTYNQTTTKTVALNSYLTTNEGTKYIRFRPSTEFADTRIKVKLQKGTKATAYSEYGKGTVGIKQNGKNLFNINDTTYRGGNADFQIKDNKIIINSTGTLGAQLVQNFVKELDVNKNYTLSFKAKKTILGTDGCPYIRIYVYGSNDDDTYTTIKCLEEQSPILNHEYTFLGTVTGYKYYRFYIYNSCTNPVTVGEQTEYYDIQFEEGIVATEYEPYIGNNYVPQISEPLRSLPNGVRDTIEEDGIHRRVGSVVLKGNENITAFNNIYYIRLLDKKGRTEITKGNILCSHFKETDKAGYNVMSTGEMWENYYTDPNVNIFFNYDNGVGGIDNFKDYIAEQYTNGTPLIVQYELAEEIIEPYEDNPLQKATSYKNITHIFSTDEVSPVFDITYKKDLETLFNNLNSALVQGGV